MGKQGDRISGGGNRRVMRRKNDGWFWSEETEEAFFDHLASSCNVSAAAEAVGFCTPTVYRMRRRRPEFAARWQAALEQGYARLEMALLLAANDTLEGKPFDDSRPIPKMTVDQAMNVLRAHRNAVEGDGRRGPGRGPRRRHLDEVRESILVKVRAIRAMEEAAAPALPEASLQKPPPAGGRGQGAGCRASQAVHCEDGGSPPAPLPLAEGGENA